jgi:peptidoglycan/LPS O-acetylase OafA/YrhL
LRSTNIQEIHYRPDIDGLRAIAVLSVIAFHVAPNTFKGGFIGVDIFFVISGFLITSIILSDLSRSQFSFIDFYSRRIRRIFPALLLVLAAAYIFGWFALLAQELTQLSKHIVSGSLFISNLVLWNESGYFDNFIDRKLFLNLWSLGVEEQFYLFWPLILYAGMRFKTSFLKIIISILLISFSWNIYQTDINTSAAFYSPLTRFWELLIGAILGYFSFDQKYTAKVESNKSSSLRANLCSLVGFLLITLGIFLIDKRRSFPGWWAMLPTIGAALIIWAGEKTFLNKHILGNRLSV